MSARSEGVVVSAAVGVVGIVFGVLAEASGLSPAKSIAMSVLVFTGASQFAAAGIIASGGSPAAALGSALLLAARNALYGPIVAKWFANDGTLRRAALAHVIIDESTGVGAAQDNDVDHRRGFITAGIGVLVAWTIGTVIGVTVGDLIGDLETWGLDAAFPAVFLALMAPHLRSHPGRVTAIVSAAAAIVTLPFLPVGLPILVAVIGAFVGSSLGANPITHGHR